MPFSVLFPEVHRLVIYSLVRNFPVLQLRCVKPLLAVCGEKLTLYVIMLPDHPDRREHTFLKLDKMDRFDEARIDTAVRCWQNQISMYDDVDIARVVLPKIYRFVQNEILLRETGVSFRLSDNDIVALSMLLVKNTNVFYTGTNWWANNRQIANTFERWFCEV